MMNENAIANILVDLDFLDEQFRGVGRANLVSLFTELRAVRIALSPRLAHSNSNATSLTYSSMGPTGR
jgi:hypothetical protein